MFCGSCGNENQKSGKFCGFCGKPLQQTVLSDSVQLNPVINPRSHLKINLEGVFKNEKYKIIGRIKYSTYDAAEQRRYLWDEWLLISEQGRYLWLSEDEWTFQLTSAFTPKIPFNPDSVTNSVNLDGKSLYVIEKGIARIEYFEGELNYKPETGEEINYLDIMEGYSVEWDDREIKFFKSEEIPVEQIYKAFNLDVNLIPLQAYQKTVEYEDSDEEIPKSIDIRSDKTFYHYDAEVIIRRQTAKTRRNVPLLFITCGLLLILVSISCTLSGKKVYTFSARPIECKEGKLLGPMKLTKAGSLYLVRVKGGIASDSNYDLTLELFDEDEPDTDIPLWSKEDQFWHESGVEYEEGQSYPWTESYSAARSYFLLSEEGEYYLKVTAEGTDKVLSSSGRLTIAVYEGVIHGRYYFWSGFLLILLGVII
ncbi:MAG TPA: DUF4178 domain-containing protein [Candidatus Eremiobacteraeota bacterium]|nr:MAG: hypothetical protein BWY64_00130 [bacterium ADurb.Bin363]HPZ06569.1 DUF4178 domain-containing protein [Candidatus Eremiobacteraeota bacterium]